MVFKRVLCLTNGKIIMTNFRSIYNSFCILVVLSLLLSSCGKANQNDLSTEELMMINIDFLSYEIQSMHDDMSQDYLYEMPIYIAFADIDFDGIPEFFFGYQTMTGSHNKVWYRAFSLKEGSIIDPEHPSDWSTYLSGDTGCAFFTGSENFLEGYYLNDNKNPCFVTKTYAGSVTDIRTDYVFIEYEYPKLSIAIGFEFDKEIQPIKQIWSLVDIDNIQSEISNALQQYLNQL